MMTKFLFSLAILVCMGAVVRADIASMKKRIPKILELKGGGFICEKLDGYLKKVKGGADVASVVTAENKDRLKVYAKRAKPKNLSVVAYAKEVGALKVKKTRKGQLYEKSPGNCVAK